ncbi:hypothetical protein BY996DRAFT_7252481 [Phakopsora pachyrhizi]|nr:hypothetical protein BY996DRAFT_7252481 [Phakopsora pachyrhizi]
MLPLLLVLSHKTNLEVAKDPIFLISSALVICSPPAITLSQMVSKARDEKFECMVSDILFWSHTLVT